MPEYSNYDEMIRLLREAQSAEEDNRRLVKEANLFVSKDNGQWEQWWWDKNDGKPRYTFDQTTPIIDQVAGQMEQSEFGIDVEPTGGEASKKTAEVIGGMIRNIETISDASHIYSTASRNIATSGFDAWHLNHKHLSPDSFDQDIVIEPVYNAWQRVWWDTGSQRQDRADANHGWLLSAVSETEYRERWPDRSGTSAPNDEWMNAYYHKPNMVLVGHFYYVEEKKRELVKTNFGRVFTVDDDWKKVSDELKAAGEVEVDRRVVMDRVFMLRRFDGDGWLDDARETVWNRVPVIPVYANFKIIEEKIVYHGIVQKMMDAQRVLNYSLSREIEEGALAPRAKYWMTKKQAKSPDVQKTLRTLNTNSDPVQFYDADAEAPGVPQQQGGAQINPGLRTISEGMQNLMSATAGIFAAGMGDNPNAQSGVAIERLQNKGNNVTSKYFLAMEVAICATARAIIDAIPQVYDVQRQVRIIQADGASE